MKLRIILPSGSAFNFDYDCTLEVALTDIIVREIKKEGEQDIYTINVDKSLEHLRYDIQTWFIKASERLMNHVTEFIKPQLERMARGEQTA